uniref:Ribonuclease III n=1 Tax=Rhizophora mucronata TaxID=61149 RepID=A0A2P2Q4I7_RHIMU
MYPTHIYKEQDVWDAALEQPNDVVQMQCLGYIPVNCDQCPFYAGLNYKQPIGKGQIIGLHASWDISERGGNIQQTLELNPQATPIAPAKSYHNIWVLLLPPESMSLRCENWEYNNQSLV